MENFVSFEIAKKLKEKGFREKVNAYYGKYENIFYIHPALDMNDCDYCCSAPTISKVLKWLREEKGIYLVIEVIPSFAAIHKVCFCYKLYLNSNGEQINCRESEESYMTFESASLEGIKDVLDYYI